MVKNVIYGRIEIENDLTIESLGELYFYNTYNTYPPIIAKNLIIKGEGSTTVTGNNGNNGYNAPWEGADGYDGQDGATAIYVREKVTIESESVIIAGGNGGTGGNGADSISGLFVRGGDGGNGGKGGNAIGIGWDGANGKYGTEGGKIHYME